MLTRDLLLPADVAFSYVASRKPQQLHIELTVDKALKTPLAALVVQAAMTWPRLGLAAADRFSVLDGVAKKLAGPDPGTPEALEPSAAWVYEVASVAPEFLVWVAVYLTTRVRQEARPTRVSIWGDRPATRDEPAYTDDQMRDWVRTDAYPGPAGGPQFPVHEQPVDNGMEVRLTLAGPVKPEHLDQLQDRLEAVLGLARFSNLDPKEPPQKFSLDLLGKPGALTNIAHGRREITARVDLLQMNTDPVRAVLLNTLNNFHQTVAPIEQLGLWL